MPKFKNGVVFWNMHPDVLTALQKIDKISKRMFGTLATVTAGREGNHMETSLHYEGRAFDIRIKHILHHPRKKPGAWKLDPAWCVVEKFKENIAKQLGVSWDVVLESTHIHCEFDPN